MAFPELLMRRGLARSRKAAFMVMSLDCQMSLDYPGPSFLQWDVRSLLMC